MGEYVARAPQLRGTSVEELEELESMIADAKKVRPGAGQQERGEGMRPWTELLCHWLVDYYALATVVVLAALGVMGRLRQPARRLLVARFSAVVGLAALVILAALPGWPRSAGAISSVGAGAGPTEQCRGLGAGFSHRDLPAAGGPNRTSSERGSRSGVVVGKRR